MTGTVLRLYPLPPREFGALYEDLELPPPERRAPSGRPYVIINMVSSVDGKTSIGGKSSRIGSEIDRQAMRTLRSKADAVMVGAGTIRAERLSLGLDEPEDPQPLAIVATRSGDVPLKSNFIVGDRQQCLIVTTENAPEDIFSQLAKRARVMRVPADSSGAVDLAKALRTLRSEHAVQLLLVEGGPTLNHALISAHLADELFFTLAPKLLGGTTAESLTILNGAPLAPTPLHLLSAYLAGDELFLHFSLHKVRDT